MKAYRHDIDGLRALAVFLVIFFHYQMFGVYGGFVGVDVFFVISGFLITSIILKDLNAEAFSLSAFWERRIRRIFPALFCVGCLSLIAGFILFLPQDYISLSQSVSAAVTGMANIFFWLDMGYFSAAADTRPMLHAWSLSVEEQFYLFVPIALSLLFKFQKNIIFIVMALGCLVSFALCVYASYHYPSANFYLLPTRFWELGLGSVLASYGYTFKNKTLNEALGIIGILMIIGAAFMLDSHTRFPGLYALIPCLGTVLFIVSAQDQQTQIARFFTLGPLRLMGKISYSLYLFHWPIWVFYLYVSYEAPTLSDKIILTALCVALSYASWRWVENPWRDRNTVKNRKIIFSLALVCVTAALVFSTTAKYFDGFPNRMPANIQNFSNAMDDIHPAHDTCRAQKIMIDDGGLKPCIFGYNTQTQKPDLVIWGDSHTLSPLYTIIEDLKENKISAAMGFGSSCPPVLGVHLSDDAGAVCHKFNTAMFDYISEIKPKAVLLMARWSVYNRNRERGYEDKEPELYLDHRPHVLQDRHHTHSVFKSHFIETVDRLNALGTQVFVLRQTPNFKDHIPRTLIKKSLSRKDLRALDRRYDEIVERQSFVDRIFFELQKQGRIDLLDTHTILCDGSVCFAAKDAASLYRDDDYLSKAGAFMLRDLFKGVIKQVRTQ